MNKRKNKSLGINAALNAFKSGLAIIFPLITYPYAFRILHTEGIGKVNYATSIISYFALIAALGISTYAVREGAKLRGNKKKFDQFCNEIFSLNVITTIVAYVLLLFSVLFLDSLKEYRELLILLSLTIIFTTLGIEWINTIFEDFLFITIRSIGIYLITLILLFVLVKNENDYMKYAFLTVVTSGCICISNWVYCRKYVKIKLTHKIQIKRHIKPILTFFANSVATSIYVNSDTTMLGYLAGDHFVGLYALAVKIYNVIKTMLAALYTVAVPRLSYFVGMRDEKSIKKTFTSLFSNLTIILLPASMGLAVISREIVIIMGGYEYIKATVTLQVLSFSLIGAIFGGAITYCLNIPLGREKINAKATTLSAIINMGLNIFMIPIFKQNGAAITTAVAEFFVVVYCTIGFKDIRTYLDINKWGKNLFQAIVGCVSILLIAISIKMVVAGVILRILVIIIASIIIYALELCWMKNDLAVAVLKKLYGTICR